MTDYLMPLEWREEEFSNFGLFPQVNRHRYNEHPLFERESLTAILDAYPREQIRCYTMGTDPECFDDWQIVDIATESSGEDIWRAVEKGRIWINLLNAEKHNSDIFSIVSGMYSELGKKCPHLGNPTPAMTNLLISSPGAMVYFHMDAEANMLWHLKGTKRLWIYPDMDLRFVSQETIEDIYSGISGEWLPYKPEFDDHATQFLLNPGEVASWPHNSPHRIQNIDLNVSLATSFNSSAVFRRKYLQLSNKFLLRKLGITKPSLREDGLIAALKRSSFRLINKARPFKTAGVFRPIDPTHLVLDPEGDGGIMRLIDPVLPYYARVRIAKSA
jgi:hypothetical protein